MKLDLILIGKGTGTVHVQNENCRYVPLTSPVGLVELT